MLKTPPKPVILLIFVSGITGFVLVIKRRRLNYAL